MNLCQTPPLSLRFVSGAPGDHLLETITLPNGSSYSVTAESHRKIKETNYKVVELAECPNDPHPTPPKKGKKEGIALEMFF